MYRSTRSSPGLSSSAGGGQDCCLAVGDEPCRTSRMSASSAACAVWCRGSASSSPLSRSSRTAGSAGRPPPGPARVRPPGSPRAGRRAHAGRARLALSPGAADHQDPVMTSYLPLTCLAATLARVRVPGPGAAACPGSPCRQSLRRRGGGPLATAAGGPGAAVRAGSAARLGPVQKFFHRDHGSPPATPAWVRRQAVPGPAGPGNHRDPVMAAHRPGGEPGHAPIDTRRRRSR
jgi:hypothetical protein